MGVDDQLPEADEAAPQPRPQAAGRTRQCIVTRKVLPEDQLIRFAVGPEGAVVPDVARKLPGRGLWVEAERGVVEQAVKKGAFSRAAKARLAAPADLADQVESLLKRRILQGLGLARRGGELISGNDRVTEALKEQRVAWLVEAADGSPDGRRKLLAIARHASKPPRLMGVFSGDELSLALGLENVIHLAFLAGRGVERWTVDVQRLSGFRPLLPESWREDR